MSSAGDSTGSIFSSEESLVDKKEEKFPYEEISKETDVSKFYMGLCGKPDKYSLWNPNKSKLTHRSMSKKHRSTQTDSEGSSSFNPLWLEYFEEKLERLHEELKDAFDKLFHPPRISSEECRTGEEAKSKLKYWKLENGMWKSRFHPRIQIPCRSDRGGKIAEDIETKLERTLAITVELKNLIPKKIPESDGGISVANQLLESENTFLHPSVNLGDQNLSARYSNTDALERRTNKQYQNAGNIKSSASNLQKITSKSQPVNVNQLNGFLKKTQSPLSLAFPATKKQVNASHSSLSRQTTSSINLSQSSNNLSVSKLFKVNSLHNQHRKGSKSYSAPELGLERKFGESLVLNIHQSTSLHANLTCSAGLPPEHNPEKNSDFEEYDSDKTDHESVTQFSSEAIKSSSKFRQDELSIINVNNILSSEKNYNNTSGENVCSADKLPKCMVISACTFLPPDVYARPQIKLHNADKTERKKVWRIASKPACNIKIPNKEQELTFRTPKNSRTNRLLSGNTANSLSQKIETSNLKRWSKSRKISDNFSQSFEAH